MRALSFLILLLAIAVTQPAVAVDRLLKEPGCADVRSIGYWKVRGPRKLLIDVDAPDTGRSFVVTFTSACFPRFPKKRYLRVEAKSACLAPGDSMFFTFPPPDSSQPSDTEVRCVVETVQGLLRETRKTCVEERERTFDGGSRLKKKCY